MALYTAAKFAVEGLADSYRYELSQLGIDSVIVEPGPYQTGIFVKTDPPADDARAADLWTSGGDTAPDPHRLGIVQSALARSG
jgi:NAD(P)-dependent dehydrogenase (short-subunit alcohol dehydrogenase family)